MNDSFHKAFSGGAGILELGFQFITEGHELIDLGHNAVLFGHPFMRKYAIGDYGWYVVDVCYVMKFLYIVVIHDVSPASFLLLSLILIPKQSRFLKIIIAFNETSVLF